MATKALDLKMLRKKYKDNKRKHTPSNEQQGERRRRSTECSVEKDELADPELDKVSSDMEEGGLDLSVPFKPISAYVSDRQEMLNQCFQVLGEKKLKRMLPDELKSCNVEEIKKLCQDQLEQLSQTSLLKILAGEELTGSSGGEDEGKMASESQQDNIVDSTSSLKESGEIEESKQEDAGSGEESDVLSINAEAYDSDIEGPKDKSSKPEDAAAGLTTKEEPVVAVTSAPTQDGASNPESASASVRPVETKKELEKDIDKSVSEILALGAAGQECQEDIRVAPVLEPPPEDSPEPGVVVVGVPRESAAAPGTSLLVCQPSIQQLELLELEMRARAIKALMKANEVKKTSQP